MTLSDDGLQQLMKSEGFDSHMYPDHKGYSIGFGHLLKANEIEKYKDGVSLETARLLLRDDANEAVFYVNKFIKVPLTQAQFDALVDFTYNEGSGALINVAMTLNTGDFKRAAERMKLYDKITVHGVKVVDKGLKARREREAEAFEA